MKKTASLCILVCLTLPAMAQPFSVDWFSFDGGGGSGSVAGFTLSGSVGELEGSAEIRNGSFAFMGGFWALTPLFQSSLDEMVLYSRVNPSDSSSTIWTTRLDGSSDLSLVSGYRPHLSLDHRYLVFTRDGANGNAYNSRGYIWVHDLVTHAETQVYTHGDYVIGADFTRDASQIILDFGCSDFRVNRDGTDFTFLSGGSCYDDAPAVNPVDGRVALHNTFSGILVADANAQGKTYVPNSDLGVYPHWSADGQWLSYVNQLNSQEYQGHNLFRIRPDGTGKTQLTFFTVSTDAFFEGAVWTPDGTALIGAATISNTNGLYRVAADGSGAITRLNITQPGNPIRYAGAVTGQAPPPFQLRISGLERLGADLRFHFGSRFGRNYVVQRRADLDSAPWQVVSGTNSGTGLETQVTVTNAISQPQQFYRLWELP